ncbi:hypothetical protein C8Q80DRAFT_1215286 [Daedaleopsis nitida]|nr:hypothetical protein C8Q80DRAFT_1215286 [Daedaleopsis nitida]
MAPEIRFNAFGIPYLVEFANVTFRSRSRAASVSTTTTASQLTCEAPSLHKPAHERQPSLRRGSLRRSPSVATFDSDWTFATASSETLAGPSVPKAKSSGKADPYAYTYTDGRNHTPEPFSPLLSPRSKPLPEITVEREIETEGAGLLIRSAAGAARGRLSHARLARLKYRIARAVVAAGMDSSPAACERADPLDGARREAYRASVSSIRSEEVETHGLPSSLFRGTYGQVMAALTAAGLTAAPCKASGVQDATRLGALFVAHQNPYGGVEFTKLTLWG